MSSNAQSFETRQNMNRPDFEIFHYLDREPRSVELHHHDFYEVYCFLSGDVLYRVEGREFRLQRGDLLLINPMELHQPVAMSGDVPYERIVLWINKAFLGSCSTDLTSCFDPLEPNHTNLLRCAEEGRLFTLMERLVREFYSKAFANEVYSKGLFLQLMVEVNRMVQQAQGEQGAKPLSSLVADYIGSHYREALSLDSLADHFYVSKYHLSHAFSKATGVSVHRYLVLKRLQAAKELLLEGHPPKEAYLASGFGDYANFYRAFQQAYGATPSAFSRR